MIRPSLTLARLPRARAGHATMVWAVWAAFLAAGLAATAGYATIPSRALQTAILPTLGLVAALAILAGVRRHRPRAALPWYLLAGGQLSAAVSNALWQAHILDTGEAPLPGGVSDVFWIGNYALLISALALLLTRREGAARGLLETGIVAAGVSVVAWTFLVQGYLDQSTPLLEHGTQIAYSFLDLVLFAVLVRLVLMAGRCSASERLLLAGSASLLFSDGIWNWSTLLDGNFSPGTWADIGWLLLPVLLGASALHPSMRALFEQGSARESLRPWRRQVFILALAALTGPAVMAVAAAEHRKVSQYALAAAAGVIFLLVFARMGTLLSEKHKAEEALETREEQLRQAQKMEAIGQLAGGVAHDFNNLLTAILGYSEFLLDRLETSDPRRRDVEEIREAGTRAAALTSQLLAFGRRQMLQPKVLDLNAVVSHVEALLRRLIGEDVTLATALETGLDHVRADPGQLEQVIVNLAVNARDAMPDGGTLTIETAHVEVGADEAAAFPGMLPGRYVRLALTDTGVGMDRATLARVFEPFFTTKGPGKGTGLGLATVHGIVAQSGGSVTVSSAPGKGTAFTIHLPSVAEKLEPLGTGGQHCSSHGHETILLAEDEAVVRDLAERALVERGYTVLATSSGDEALQACEGHEGAIHLLVTDVVMPGMGGKTLAERLLPLRPGLPILYVSGYADGRVVEEDTPFLQKPFSPSALAERVREALDAA